MVVAEVRPLKNSHTHDIAFAEDGQALLVANFGVIGRAVVRLSMGLGVILGLFLGPLLGCFYGMRAGLGWAVDFGMAGPGEWVARSLRRRFRRALPWRWAAYAMAGISAGLVGLLTGPFWFQFVGLNVGRSVGEVVMERFH